MQIQIQIQIQMRTRHELSSPCRLAFWLGVIGLVMVSLTPGNKLPKLEYDLLYHGIAYAGLGLLAALGHTTERTRRTAFAGLVLLGGVLELAQEFVPGRAGSAGDALANTAGVAVVVVLWWLYARRARTAAKR